MNPVCFFIFVCLCFANMAEGAADDYSELVAVQSGEHFDFQKKLMPDKKAAAIANEQFIFDEKLDFCQRAVHLDRRLLYSQESPLSMDLTKIQDSDFKRYILLICAALNPTLESFKVCATKHALMLLHKQYDMPNELPKVVRCMRGLLPNFAYDRYSPRPDIHMLCSNVAACYTKPNELIYVTDINHYSSLLSALYSESLNAVWQYRLDDDKQNCMAIFDQHVYVTDGSYIKCLNKNTGLEIARYPMPIEEYKQYRIRFFSPDANGNIYISYDTRMPSLPYINVFLNTQTGEYTILDKTFSSHMFIAHNTWGYFDRQDGMLVLRGNDQVITRVSCCLSIKKDFFVPYVAAQAGHIFFGRLLQDSTSQLVAYDSNACKELWNMPISGPLANKPCISHDEKRMFIMCRQEHGNSITALEKTDDSYKPIWSLPCLEYDYKYGCQLAISLDNKRLFVLENVSGKLYTLHADTGEISSCKKCGPLLSLLGVSQDGKPIVRHLR